MNIKNTKQNILIVNHAFDAGGISSVHHRLAKTWHDAGHDVTLYTMRNDARPSGISYLKIMSTPFNLPSVFQYAWSFIYTKYFFSKSTKFDIVIFAGVNPAFLLYKNLEKKFPDAKFIINAHTSLSNYLKQLNPLRQKLFWQIIKYISAQNALLANVSRSATEEWQNLIKQKKVHTLYNPVCNSGDLNFDEDRTNAPHPWLASDEYKAIIGCGRLVKSKNFDFMLRVFAESNDPKIRLLILGDGVERQNLEKLADELKITDRIEFLGQIDDPKRYMYHADYTWLTSKYEGFAMVLAESLAMGTPCISNNCPHGPAEVLQDGKYGLLIDGYDLEHNVRKIEKFISKPKKNRSFYRECAKDFLDEKIAENYLNLLRNHGVDGNSIK